MDREARSVDIADFITSWSKIVEEMGTDVLAGVDVTREGRVIAVVRPPRKSLHGYLRGHVHLSDGYDLTAPVLVDEMHADSSRVHE